MDTIFSDFDVHDAIEEIDHEGGVGIQRFLAEDARLALLDELNGLELKKQPALYGTHDVRQEFSSFDAFSETSLFRRIQKALGSYLDRKFVMHHPYPMQGHLDFNQSVVQRYPAGPVGISPHRDGKSFINLIAVLVLEGRGRFCFCDDRAGANTRPILNEPGALVLMRGVGFLGADIQPFHFVDRITERRTTFALRQKQTA